ncbi:tRNA (adenosine(37)-N6)-dimethylallyltransferase MiaA [Bacillus mycoides]|jgi:tRNA dimethylallyltransferase|uniref:tRNA (adenosine(37)-N6)-dimethylallyltransferase MiaA n=1 Tax=Bacillus TaxID=1386 RepID=UPI0002799672|nr:MULTISPECIES: tRNA (adenosine(37)-N6)-dimethylallyltransferase MiaA [Bacillus]EJS15478.1 tRNA dimethylallyltransferase [Bacillus cereus VDM062]MBJ7961877.1 tRNA (adenosine(37)-N6)-dimethylallyltransferase MiaA [Bacillus cereus group sp. N28]MDI6529538.1 tRNA (adenosine(37)-N6)-dimethylallyltransferase MiaA [Bacillus mycoides]PRD07657.1 tRNA (adenosine(37)-N6)-dimethylallyltransferase MiaA [Bacillus sp. MYb56]RAN66610.1 tRNA (adenosine(37)-N6)-dimethylallyltransferase MiaA [Bacillus sp. SRB_
MGEVQREKVAVIIGPTAVGKTKLSIDLAKALNGEIISGDSMQIYRTMDIGTAKVTTDEMDGIPHYMIDIKDPEDSFSVAEFQERVRKCIREITERGKLPIIVGGTGLYIQSVLFDYQFTDEAGDATYREQMEKLALEHGVEYVHKKLQEVDPESAERIHANNVRRVIRALEIFHTTGEKMSNQLEKQENELLYDVSLIGLTMDREMLYDRINLRVNLMIEQGLLEEVKGLHERGVRDCQSIQAIGYKEIYDYFENRVSLEEAVSQLKTNSRRYAKRQLTWFRNKMDVTWFDVTDGEKTSEILRYIEGKLQLKSNNSK